MFKEYCNHDVAVYGGYLQDNAKILKSASGGIATALSENIILNGGVVVGVTYSNDFYKAEYTVVNNLNDLDKLKGSKYVETDKNDIYSKVKDLLDEDKKVLFFGLPCVVGALYTYLGCRYDNLITCELVCHGATLKKVHADYILYLEKKFKSKIIDFSLRYKENGWTPSYLYAKFENGKVFKKLLFKTEYWYAFSILAKKSCYDCKFKGNNRQADIMLGDFWGATESDEFWNKFGVSVVFAETKKGDEFLNSTNAIKLFKTTFEKAVLNNQMVIKSRQIEGDSDKFYNNLINKGLFYAVKHQPSFLGRVANVLLFIFPDSFKQKVVGFIKKVIKR